MILVYLYLFEGVWDVHTTVIRAAWPVRGQKLVRKRVGSHTHTRVPPILLSHYVFQ